MGCAPALLLGSGEDVSGPWVDCVRAACIYENSNPKWKSDPSCADASPSQQVIDFFEACGHSEQTADLEKARSMMKQALQSDAASGISSSRCSERTNTSLAPSISSRKSIS